ncbi:STAS domain-containing protein [Nonomuraea sp. NBC_01738]|uniref:STAS domain-containing protein n=1 Tax=Nonomuraea sp. NBC_01738 TaxID=2976003 RepID=UPI002E0E2377|nr:STAS domain-containing protein [Nonomuraea sp. NBC_01738]
MDLSVEVERTGGVTIVRLDGDLDKVTAPGLRTRLRELAASGCRAMVIDAERLTFCDSSGLWVLVEQHRHLAHLGGALRLSGVHGILGRVLEVTGLRAVFDDATGRAAPAASQDRTSPRPGPSPVP